MSGMKHAKECIDEIMERDIRPMLAEKLADHEREEVIHTALYLAYCDGAIASTVQARAALKANTP